MYTKNNLKQILRTVLETQPSTCRQAWRTSENLPERAFKPKALDVYKNRSHIDCYNFI